jgi:hypothetical protein
MAFSRFLCGDADAPRDDLDSVNGWVFPILDYHVRKHAAKALLK